MTSAIPPIPEEMLSAYLDHELDPAERARVETALANDEQLRTVLAEIKGIRKEIQALPPHLLSVDFASRMTTTIRAEHGSKKLGKASEWSRKRHARWIGGIAASAALLLVCLSMSQSIRQDTAATRAVARVEPTEAMHDSAESAMIADVEDLERDQPEADLDVAPEDTMIMSYGVPAQAQQLATPESLAWYEGADSLDAVVRVKLSGPESRSLQESPPTTTQSRTMQRAPSLRKAAPIETAGPLGLQMQQAPDDWNVRFAELGIERPQQVIVVEGTADEVNRALLPIRAQLAETVLVRDSGTANVLSLAQVSSAGGRTLNQPAPHMGAAAAAAKAPRFQKVEDLTVADNADEPTVIRGGHRSGVQSAPKRYRLLLVVE